MTRMKMISNVRTDTYCSVHFPIPRVGPSVGVVWVASSWVARQGRNHVMSLPHLEDHRCKVRVIPCAVTLQVCPHAVRLWVEMLFLGWSFNRRGDVAGSTDRSCLRYHRCSYSFDVASTVPNSRPTFLPSMASAFVPMMER